MIYRLPPWEPLPRWADHLIGVAALLIFAGYLAFLPFYRAACKIRDWVWPEMRWPG